MDINIEQVKQGLEATIYALNSLNVSGVENFKNITMAYNNVEVILNLINSGELVIAEKEKAIEKPEKKSGIPAKKQG